MFYIIECVQDKQVCMMHDTHVIRNKKTKPKKDDLVGFMYGKERFSGRVIDFSDDEERIKQEYNSKTKPNKNSKGNKKIAHSQTNGSHVSNSKERRSYSKTDCKKSDTDNGSRESAAKAMKISKVSESDASRARREEKRHKAENKKKAQEQLNQHTEDLIISNSVSQESQVQEVLSTNSDQIQTTPMAMELDDSSSSTILHNSSQNVEALQGLNPASKDQPSTSVFSQQQGIIRPTVTTESDGSDESSVDDQQSDHRKRHRRTTEGNIIKRRRIDDESDEDDSSVSFTDLEEKLRKSDEDQLYGESYPECQMLSIGGHIFCKVINLKDAYGALNARQCGRRLLPGVFLLDALLRNSIGGTRHNNSRKNQLNCIAIRAILDFCLKLQEKRLNEGKWTEEFSELEIVEAMRQKLVDLSMVHRQI